MSGVQYENKRKKIDLLLIRIEDSKGSFSGHESCLSITQAHIIQSQLIFLFLLLIIKRIAGRVGMVVQLIIEIHAL